MTEPPDFGFAGIQRCSVSAVAWIGLSIALALVGGCTKSDPFPAETAALKALIDDYKLKWHLLDQDGRVIDIRLEGPRYDDQAIALAGTFQQLEGISIARSSITDDGLEKLPVLKTVQSRHQSFRRKHAEKEGSKIGGTPCGARHGSPSMCH